MNKAFSFLIIILISLIGCKGKINRNNSNSELTKKEKDSVLKIVDKLCGEWKIDKKINEDYSLNGIALGTMAIECLIEIDNNNLINEIMISETIILSEINVKIPKHVDTLFLQASDSVIISKEKKYYGLRYVKEKDINFIPIKKVNDSILLLVDGRKYERES